MVLSAIEKGKKFLLVGKNLTPADRAALAPIQVGHILEVVGKQMVADTDGNEWIMFEVRDLELKDPEESQKTE